MGQHQYCAFVGLVYYAVAVHTKGFGSYKQLLGVLFVQTAVAHFPFALGITLGILTGTNNAFTVPEVSGGGDGKSWVHVAVHIVCHVHTSTLRLADRLADSLLHKKA